MPQVLIGKDYEGVACVKVTKDAYNPVTTPDSNIGAFLYNSKTPTDMKITAIIDPSVEFSGAPLGASYLPSGATASNAQAACNKTSSALQMAFRSILTGESFYDLPLFDVKKFNTSTARFVQAKYDRTTYGRQDRGIVYLLKNNGSWYKGFRNTSLTWWTGTKSDTGTLSQYYTSADGFEKDICVVWRLPGDNTDVLNSDPMEPVSGQYSVQIQGDYCRVAKPGYDVRSATKTQLAFDTSSNPVKVIAAGDIAVPVGASEYDIGFSLPSGILADVHFYTGSTVYYPINPVSGISAAGIGADYWFSGTKLKFQNSAVACRARFVVYAHDDTPPTSGGTYSVLRQFTADGVGVVQFVRPGAAANPAFADIVLDTRWPTLRIIAEGYIPVTSGERTYNVNFTSSGMLPMVKFTTVHAGVSDGSVTYSSMIRTPRVRVVYIDPQKNPVESWIGGDTCYCTLTATQASFKTFRGNPVRVSYASTSAAETDTRTILYDKAPIVGIRYYIYGIPN